MSDSMPVQVETNPNIERHHLENVSAISRQIWSAQKEPDQPNRPSHHPSLPILHLSEELDAGQNRSPEPQSLSHHPETVAARRHLGTLLRQNFAQEELFAFHEKMKHFEERLLREHRNQKEIAETYVQIGRILRATGDEPLTPDLRRQVARQIIRNCAQPTIISQGAHPTCSVTAIEVRTYALYPSKAAKLLADIATTGGYTSESGITVQLDKKSMVPDKEARDDDPRQGKRAYATQLFNLTAINIWYGWAKPNLHYGQQIAVSNGQERVEEELIDSAKKQTAIDLENRKPINDPHLSADQVAFISNAITGHHEPYAVLAFQPKHLILPGEKESNVHAQEIGDEGHLKQMLTNLKAKHKLPAIALVDTNVDPLNADNGSSALGKGGGHAINVTDFVDAKKAKVSLDNEWSTYEDHPNNAVDMHDLYLCMGGPKVARLDACVNVEEAHERNKPDPVSELRLLQYSDPNGDAMTKYADQATKTISRLALSERQLTGSDRSQWFHALSAVVNQANPEDKIPLLKQIEKTKICSFEEFGILMAGAAQSISSGKHLAITSGDNDGKRRHLRASTELAEYLITLPYEIKKSYFKELRGQ